MRGIGCCCMKDEVYNCSIPESSCRLSGGFNNEGPHGSFFYKWSGIWQIINLWYNSDTWAGRKIWVQPILRGDSPLFYTNIGEGVIYLKPVPFIQNESTGNGAFSFNICLLDIYGKCYIIYTKIRHFYK